MLKMIILTVRVCKSVIQIPPETLKFSPWIIFICLGIAVLFLSAKHQLAKLECGYNYLTSDHLLQHIILN